MNLNEQLQRMRILSGMDNKPLINENTLSSQEQTILNDILGSGGLNEGIDFNTVLSKVKNYASKGLLTTAIIASLLNSTAFSQDQKEILKNISTNTTSNPNDNAISNTYEKITDDIKQDWNNFIDFVESKGLRGSTKLDVGGTELIDGLFVEYAKLHPDTKINAAIIPSIQAALLDYKSQVLKSVAAGHSKLSVPVEQFMSKLSKVDGRAGSNTTSYKFPQMFDVKNGQKTAKGFSVLPK